MLNTRTHLSPCNPPSSVGLEARKHFRKQIGVMITVRDEACPSLLARVVDLSQGGILVELENEMSAGDKLVFEFTRGRWYRRRRMAVVKHTNYVPESGLFRIGMAWISD